jgi:hypothetical protein
MKLNSFLTLATIVAVIFGLAFLFVPAQLTALYGVNLTPATEVLGRITGSTILAFAIVYWGARNGPGVQAWKAAMVAALVTNGLDCLIMLHATGIGLVNSYGWAQAAINGLLTLGFAYFVFGKR